MALECSALGPILIRIHVVAQYPVRSFFFLLEEDLGVFLIASH